MARLLLTPAIISSVDSTRGNRASQVREAFNSPFWPFALATTSVGQEGLDFHHYCHAIVPLGSPVESS